MSRATAHPNSAMFTPAVLTHRSSVPVAYAYNGVAAADHGPAESAREAALPTATILAGNRTGV